MVMLSSTHIRRRLMATTAAVVIALAPQAAFAQFAGTPSFDPSQIEIVDEGRVILVREGFAEIDWRAEDPTDGLTIDFLPADNAVAYWDEGLLGDYVVLNRVFGVSGEAADTRPIAFNGAVGSFVGDSIGGTLWFYSPNGILVGENAFFDVGSLLLSTGEIVRGEGGGITVRGADGATPAIENRGLINARDYAVLVAPRISQSATGQVRAGGTAAMVGAQSATLTLGEGLFDIVVDVGVAGGEGDVIVDHDGETISTGGGTTPSVVYMVAVSRQDAMTLALGGTVQALDAAIDANGVVISGGGNIVDGEVVARQGGGIVDVEISPDNVGVSTPHVSTGAMVVAASGDVSLADATRLEAIGNLGLVAGGAVAMGNDVSLRSDGQLGVFGNDGIAIGARASLVGTDRLDILSGGGVAIGEDAALRGGEAARIEADDAVSLAAGASIEGDVVDVISGTAITMGANSRIFGGSVADLDAQDNVALAEAASVEGDLVDLSAGGTIALANDSLISGGSVVALDAGGDVSLAADASIEGERVDIGSDGAVLLAAGSRVTGGDSVAIQTGTALSIAGAVEVTDGGTGSEIDLVAGTRIDVRTPSGSVRLVDESGAPAGLISMTAPRIVVADESTRNAVSEAATVEERETLLESNGGVEQPQGYVSAARIEATVSEAILVQNSGSATAFSGLAADTIAIRPATGSVSEILVFGRALDADGGLVTDFRLRDFAVDLTQPFAPGSSINNCLLALPTCFPLPPDTVRPPLNEIVGIIGSETTTAVNTLSLELTEVGGLDLNALGLIDDPVTGTGDTPGWRFQTVCLEEDKEECP